MYKTKQNLKGKSHTINAADVMESTINELRGQHKTEMIGFCILLFGLIMQFCGNFNIYANSNDKLAENHKLQLECRSLGERIDKEINPSDNPNGQIPYVPEYYYNQKLGKCFYFGGYDDHIAMFHTLIDVYTNKDIASLRQYIKEGTTEGNFTEFYNKKRELFNEK